MHARILLSGGEISRREAFNLQQSSANLFPSQELLWDEAPLRNTQDLPCIFELAPPKILQQSLDVNALAPVSSLWPSSGLAATVPCSYVENTRTVHSIPSKVSQEQSRVAGSPPLTC